MRIIGYLKKKVNWDLRSTYRACGYTGGRFKPFGGVHPNPAWERNPSGYYPRWKGTWEWDGKVPVFYGTITIRGLNRGSSGANIKVEIQGAGEATITLNEFYNLLLRAAINPIVEDTPRLLSNGRYTGYWTFKKQGANSSLVLADLRQVDLLKY